MATTTYEPIISYTLPSDTPTVTLGSGGQGTIPSTYTDLVVVVTAQGNGANNFTMRFNGDTGNNYSTTGLSGNGSSAYSWRTSSTSFCFLDYYGVAPSSGGFATYIINIQNYASTSTYRTAISRYGYASNATEATVSLWRNNTTAINSITFNISNFSSNIKAGSTFTLYGIANSDNTTSKATGGTVYSDSTYYYHVFNLSGNFVPKQSLSCDILVVAGGGGGGAWNGGGGGAGGLLAYTSQSLTAQNYNVTVGGGGNGGVYNAAGSAGSNSQFGSLTAAVGGGYGGGDASTAGGSGGSGGGGAYAGAGGSATSGQGYAGGSGKSSGPVYGGGGGGATAAGANGSGNTGQGGAGYYSTFTDAIGAATNMGQLVSSHYYYAGGGSGGNQDNTSYAGGIGGGGASGTGYNYTVVASTAGLINTGGGGGGGTALNNGAAGGSGIVIVRYAK